MSSAWPIAKRELITLRRDRLFIILGSFLVGAALLSVMVAAAAYRSELDAYRTYVQELQAAGNTVVPAPPQLFALQQLRGGVEYLEIIGALLAIVLGYGAIAKEKHRRTLPLLLTRPLGRFDLPLGKVLGLAIVWAVVVAAIMIATTLALLLVGTATLDWHDLLRILIAAVITWLYLVMWSAISVAITSLSRRVSTALVVGIVVWLVFVLILPQIGDTMDPDNQVPGGLFATLGIPKDQENAVLAHFSSYDTVRNGIEVTSITKHFERLSFAVLGIKSSYAGQPLSFVWHDTWGYAIALIAVTAGAIGFAVLTTTRSALQRRSS